MEMRCSALPYAGIAGGTTRLLRLPLFDDSWESWISE
jgi:hypothetical protein